MKYPNELNDREWALIEPFFRRPDRRGKVAKYEVRTVVNAIFYVTKTGCQWRYLPHDFPPWTTVYKRFERWNKSGVWEQALDSLTRKVREKQGRTAEPSYAIIDTQSVKTVYDSEERGFDGGKKNQRQETGDRNRHARKSTGGTGTIMSAA